MCGGKDQRRDSRSRGRMGANVPLLQVKDTKAASSPTPETDGLAEAAGLDASGVVSMNFTNACSSLGECFPKTL